MRPAPERPIRSRRDLGPSYAPLERGFKRPLAIQIIITSPTGQTLDVTHRWEDDFEGIEEIVEIELTQLSHSDVSLNLDDRDRTVRNFLIDAKSTDIWTVHIDRETGKRRPKWERLFAGVLDLPWSLEIDHVTDLISLQVFGFTKLLEQTSAESVQTTQPAMTGSATIATADITGITPDTDSLRVGDTVTLDDGENKESKKIISKNTSGTEVTCDSNFGVTFVGSILTNDTPYHRFKTVAFLVEELFNAAGITNLQINLGVQTPTRPGIIKSVVDTGNDFHGSADHFAGIEWNERIVSSDLDLFRNGVFDRALKDVTPAVTAAGKMDWSPGDDRVWFSTTIVSGSIPHDISWRILGNNSSPSELKFKDGVQDPLSTKSVGDFRTIAQLGVVAYKPLNGNTEDDIIELFRTPDLEAFPDPPGPSNWWRASYTVIGVEERLRMSTLRAAHGFVAGIYVTASGTATRIVVYDARVISNWIQVFDVQIVGSVTETEAENLMTCFVSIDKPIFIGYADGTYFIVQGDQVDAKNWTFKTMNVTGLGVATPPKYILDRDGAIEIMTPESPDSVYRATEVDGDFTKISENSKVFIDWHPFGILDSIPYADFKGMSVAQALKELALVTACYVTVSQEKVGKFLKRNINTLESIAELSPPIERNERPIFEFFRDSVEVKGEDEDGNKFEFIAGDAGSSGKRLSISTKFAQSGGKVRDIALDSLAYLNVNREENELVIDEGEILFRVLDVVTMDSKNFLVIEAKNDILERTQELRLIEVI